MGEKYRPPAGPGSNDIEPKKKPEFTPPVGPGSKSVEPSVDWRELPQGLLPDVKKVEE